MRIMNDKMRMDNEFLRDMVRKTDEYIVELTDMLIEDGYMKKGENLDGLRIRDDDDKNGEMTINGYKIKEKDQIKYRALRDKHFNEGLPRVKRTYGRSE